MKLIREWFIGVAWFLAAISVILLFPLWFPIAVAREMGKDR